MHVALVGTCIMFIARGMCSYVCTILSQGRYEVLAGVHLIRCTATNTKKTCSEAGILGWRTAVRNPVISPTPPQSVVTGCNGTYSCTNQVTGLWHCTRGLRVSSSTGRRSMTPLSAPPECSYAEELHKEARKVHSFIMQTNGSGRK